MHLTLIFFVTHNDHCYTHTGIYSVIGLVYVSEMSPSHIRGRLALASYLHTGGGILIGSIAVGLFSLDTEHAYTLGWRLDILCLTILICMYVCIIVIGFVKRDLIHTSDFATLKKRNFICEWAM